MEPVILMVAKFGATAAGVLAAPLAMYAIYSALRGGAGEGDPETGDPEETIIDPLSLDPHCHMHVLFDDD